MTTRNIFASIDVKGFIEKYKTEIIKHYGIDVTSKYISEDLEKMLISIKNGEKPLMKIGYYDISVLPSYTRLISSKDTTIGYKLTSRDYKWLNESKGLLQLNNLYNLMIQAYSGDKIRWWGHSIRPNSHIQAVISDVHKINKSARPLEFTNFERKNIQFYYASEAIKPENLKNGVEVSTQKAYCIECLLDATSGQTINYDIDLMLLSIPFNYNGSLISVPIVEIVIDPTIIVN